MARPMARRYGVAVRGRTPQYLRGVEITSERLTLKAFQRSDADTVFGAIDRTLARFMVWDQIGRAHV